MPFRPRSLPDRDQLLADNPGLEDRFFRLVRRGNPGECWEWLGTPSQDYGRISIRLNGRSADLIVTRIAHVLFHGSINDDLYVSHLCHNKRCVNPRHLLLTSHAGNMEQTRALNRYRRYIEEGGGEEFDNIVAYRVISSDLDDDDDDND